MATHLPRKMLIAIFVALLTLFESACAASMPPAPTSAKSSIKRSSMPPERSSSFGNLTAWEVACGYAVSGMYCQMQRYLFYAIAIFAFCFRFHSWLTAIAVAFLVTNSLIIACHCLILEAIAVNSSSDMDSIAAYGLLWIAVAIAWNFVFFCPRMFRRKVRIGFCAWAVALSFAYLFSGLKPGSTFEEFTATKVCKTQGGCVDICVTVDVSSSVRSSSDNVVPVKIMKLIEIPQNSSRYPDDLLGIALDLKATLDFDWTGMLNDLANLLKMRIAGKVILVSIAAAISFCYSMIHASPRTLRNHVFRRLQRIHLSASFIKMFSGTLHRLARGRIIPTIVYLSAHAQYFMWPTIFLWAVIMTETHLTALKLPEAEGPHNVGQWGPWVGVVFAIIVALLDEKSRPITDQSNIWRLQGEKRPSESERPRWLLDWEQGWYWYIVVKTEYDDFQAWWRDPVDVSRRDAEVITAYLDEDVGISAIWKRIEQPGLIPSTQKRPRQPTSLRDVWIGKVKRYYGMLSQKLQRIS